jgi:mono/diheme cytochrome c family protein
MQVLARAARHAAFAAFAALVACGDAGSPAAKAEAPAAAPAAAPAGAPAPADPAKGAAHYAALCASCHGEKGCGDGPLAATLTPKPAKHCDGAYMNKLTDEYLFRVIKFGGASVGKSPLMAPWGGTLDDAQIRDVVAFVRTLAVPPYKPKS